MKLLYYILFTFYTVVGVFVLSGLYEPSKLNQTILYVIAAIFMWKLAKGEFEL